MRLESVKNKGIKIYPGARISNSQQILSDITSTDLMRFTAGVHSINEFENKVYLYIDGEFSGIHTKEQMDEIGGKYTFFFLRQAQLFTHHLWLVKDNNVYVRDGFLLAYERNFEDGFTYKASLSAIFSYSNGERKESLFSDEEIFSAIRDLEPYKIDEFDDERFNLKYPDSDLFFKNKGSERMNRSSYFTVVARASSTLPIKIVNYCTALECLFTIGTSEINHKIAERVAIILGTSVETKVQLFNLIKQAYKIRSHIVHGQYLKGCDEDLKCISQELD